MGSDMMQFKFQIGTKVFFGKGCIRENKAEFGKYGKRAVIVTGKSSGRASGALEDVTSVLNELEIQYYIYEGVENNPSLENVKEGGKKASEFEADFIIGIGGGSPLDAAKAVATLAVNDMEAIELYKNVFNRKPLPVIAIPTTSGTGSEVTPYSILTRKDMQTKMSFGNEDTFPKVAFLDATYTGSMSNDVMVNTAVDALSHAVEGYLSRRSMPVSDVIAEEAIRIFGKYIPYLLGQDLNFQVREELLYMSMLGGMVIAHTGTTIMHGMGYSLTYFKGIPHGKANGLLMKEYLEFNYPAAKEKIDHILRLLNQKDVEAFGKVMNQMLHCDERFTGKDIEEYALLAMKQRSTSSNIRDVSRENLVQIMEKSLEKK